MHYATNVGELISALQRFRPDQPVIGEHCRAKLVIVEQTGSGSVLVAQASSSEAKPGIVNTAA